MEQFKVVISGGKCLDISKKEINKGKAIKLLQKKLGILSEKTMVFGDYLNDLEMMQEAKYSFAMKNAQPEVKEVAHFITEYDNTEDGVIKTIVKQLKI